MAGRSCSKEVEAGFDMEAKAEPVSSGTSHRLCVSQCAWNGATMILPSLAKYISLTTALFLKEHEHYQSIYSLL